MSHENADLVRKSFLEIGVPAVWDAVEDRHRLRPPRARRIGEDRDHPQGRFASSSPPRASGTSTMSGAAASATRCCRRTATSGPGMVLVGTDSHTTTHGAFGAFATGIGATEMAGVWTEGTLWFKVPSTLRIEVEGEFRPWISRQGPDPSHHRQARRGRGRLPRRGVRRSGHPAHDRGFPHGARQPAMEMGAKVAFTPVDEVLLDYLRPRVAEQDWRRSRPDPDARYESVIRVDAGEDLWEPQIACPHAVDHVKPLSALGEVPVHQAVLGSLHQRPPGRSGGGGAHRRRDATVHPRTRLIVIPASQQIYLRGDAAGLPGDTGGRRARWSIRPAAVPAWACTRAFSPRARTASPPPTATSSGRMGSKDSLVYLASPGRGRGVGHRRQARSSRSHRQGG